MGLIMHKGEAFGSSGGNSSDLIPTDWETYRALQLAGEVDPDAYYFVNDIDTSSLLPTLINEPADNNVLAYDETSGIWKNKILTADDIPYDENTSVEDELSSLNSAIATKANKKVLLWSNSSPTDNFAGQHVIVPDISSYDAIQCYHAGGQSEIILGAGRAAYGYLTVIGTSSGLMHVWSRYFYKTSDTTITISDCTKTKIADGTTSVDNASVTPLRLYGIKF